MSNSKQNITLVLKLKEDKLIREERDPFDRSLMNDYQSQTNFEDCQISFMCSFSYYLPNDV